MRDHAFHALVARRHEENVAPAKACAPNPDPFAIDVLQCRSETDCTLKVLNLTRKIHIVSRFSIAITKIAIIEGQRSYPCCAQNGRNRRDIRSEEHTSELQSLMRISYAVFCLT